MPLRSHRNEIKYHWTEDRGYEEQLSLPPAIGILINVGIVKAFTTYVRPLLEYYTYIWSPHDVYNINISNV